MASTDVQTRQDQFPAPQGTPSPSHRAPLFIAGGISGIIGVVAYGSILAPPLHDAIHSIPVEASQPVIVATFWIAALFPVFALIMVYALYRLLDSGGFVVGVVAFSIVAMHNMVQSSVLLWGSDLARSDPTFSPETWSSVIRAVRGVDIGLDLAWDLFLVLWLVFTGVAMMKHPRFGPWWGLPAIIVGAVLFAVNAITVPDPPAAVGLFDPGPLAGLYAGAVSAYLIKLGLNPRPETTAAKTTGGTARGTFEDGRVPEKSGANEV
jgi:hypothetical protein